MVVSYPLLSHSYGKGYSVKQHFLGFLQTSFGCDSFKPAIYQNAQNNFLVLIASLWKLNRNTAFILH